MKARRPGIWASLPEPLRRDVIALVIAGASALGFVALADPGAPGLERALGQVLRALLGRGALLLPLAGAGLCMWLLFLPRTHGMAARLIGAALAVADLATALSLGLPQDQVFALGWGGHGGGLIGASGSWMLTGALGGVGAKVVLITAAVAALLLVIQFSLRQVLAWPAHQAARGASGVGRAVYDFVTEPPSAEAPGVDRPKRRRTKAEPAPEAPAPAEEPPVAALPAPEPEPLLQALPAPAIPTGSGEDLPDLIGHRTAVKEAASAAEARAQPISGAAFYQSPPIDLLRRTARNRARVSKDTGQRALQLEEALRSFGVVGKVVEVTEGPAITRFEVQPGPGVKVSRISGLADDMALVLQATDVRIVAPIPGKAAVGIEVPNADVTPVYLRDVMESSEFKSAASPLTICLGQDIAGKPVVATLERLLHVLVAGATGSGKSIAINSMLVSLLYKSRPDQVRLVLIDPKRVELYSYNGIPHLLAPVVTDPKKASATLRVVVKEMERRYGLFTEAGARNITSYNESAAGRGEAGLPFVVVVIDELADLMLVARGEVEDSIQRLTQMARAAGIHLIVATQRPSVDVITGVIKANIPTRIALAVASQIDSRTILDGAGAEKLVGRGDMLFRPMGVQKVVRAQGAFIAESEVEAVLGFLRQTGRPEYDMAIMEAEDDEGGGSGPGGDAGDDLFADALQVVVESGQASVSNLQRRLRVGFTRAGRLIDMMEQRGFVGPHQGSKSREVLMTPDQFQRLYGQRGS